jgi:propionyl-CoA carboxylase alpha chain
MAVSDTEPTVIYRLLVANRGEIASRVIRTARAMDIATVAVYSEADADAPYVQHADRAVPLPGTSPADGYLRADLLVEAALVTGCDAVHPGYGFLSENAGFARACAEAGLVFVGPSPEAIESMGSKTRAKELMADAGVPVLPGIVIEDPDSLPDDLAERAGSEVGYPVLVKAAYGGGGRGMRVVTEPADLPETVASASREAASAFGDGTVFLEHFVESPRHVEVQIFGDSHGNVVHLFERECSLQRRYQKIVEESPSPAVDDELRERLGSAAVAAGKAIGYVGAGTVEFVLAPDGRFFFLEVNTRLQVEHPVTELVTGLDLVRLQLLVAEGRPLPEEALHATMAGHAIEARLYAEDVAAGFLPASGTLHRFRVPDLPGVRVDAGVADGSVVSVHYDPMLAKVIAHGPTRDDARRLLARALSESQLHGPATNRALLVGILREPEFASGAIDTAYLERHDPADLEAQGTRDDRPAVLALAAALAGQADRRVEARVLTTLPSGWRNVANTRQLTSYLRGEAEVEVGYRLDKTAVDALVDGQPLGPVSLVACTPSSVDLVMDGVREHVDVLRVGGRVFLDGSAGTAELVEVDRFPDPAAQTTTGSLLAPMPGTVVKVAVTEGDRVTSGQPVVVLEAMKMEHTVAAPYDGTVTELNAVVSKQVDVGTVLAVVEPEE